LDAGGWLHMKFLPLIWAGLWRNKPRFVLTALSLVAAFALFGMLQGISLGMRFAIQSLHVDRLYVMNRISQVAPLPLAQANSIRRIPGVLDVAHWTYFVGFFQDPRNSLAVYATNPVQMFRIFPELHLPPTQLASMTTTRTGAVVGRDLATKFGWKVGDRLPLGTAIWLQKDGSRTWDFEIVGIYDVVGRSPVSSYSVFVNFDYFDEARAFGNGYVHMFIVSLADARDADSIAKSIDRSFENSGADTRTRNEQAYARAQIKQIDAVQLIANAIAGSVLFTLLFVIANAMAQSVREREPEFAVLKAIGFTPGMVLLLVLAESSVIVLGAAGIGLMVARASFPLLARQFGDIEMPKTTYLLALGMGGIIAIISAAWPAIRAMRTQVADALSGR
jgi:putative ABC transport system permease protein